MMYGGIDLHSNNSVVASRSDRRGAADSLILPTNLQSAGPLAF
jgi:hypothetical protein